MKKLVLFLLLGLTCCSVNAKKYPWKGLDHDYNVTMLKQIGADFQLLKVFAVAGNADKAIDCALQDAVASAIFTGYKQKLSPTPTPPMCKNESDNSTEFYEKNKVYFDSFFETGDFFQYVENVNKSYPSGENNIAVDGGRQVGVFVKLNRTALRHKLEADGIIHNLNL